MSYTWTQVIKGKKKTVAAPADADAGPSSDKPTDKPQPAATEQLAPKASGDPAAEQTQVQAEGKGKKKQKQQPAAGGEIPTTAPPEQKAKSPELQQQPEPAAKQPQVQAGGKGKKKHKQPDAGAEKPTSAPPEQKAKSPEPQQPQQKVKSPEPQQPQQQGRGAGRGRDPQQQQQQQQPARGAGRGQVPQQQPVAAPQPGAWGRGGPQQPQQQQPGRGPLPHQQLPQQQLPQQQLPQQQLPQQQLPQQQLPPQQAPPQQPRAWGRGQPQQPPPVEQPPQGAWGRKQQQAPEPLAQQQFQQPQQQPAGRGRGGRQSGKGRGDGKPGTPEQQPLALGARGRGQSPTDSVSSSTSSSVSTPSTQVRGPPSARTSSSDISVKSLVEPIQQIAGPTKDPRQRQQKMPPQQKVSPPKEETTKSEGPGLELPRRKDIKKGGTLGHKIQIETNHLALQIQPKYDHAVHYDITITPDKPKRMMRVVWEEFRRKYIPKCQAAFDDVKNVYSPTDLPFDNGEFAGEVSLAEDATSRPKVYTVVIKFASRVNLRTLFDYMRSGGLQDPPQEALQCIDIVLRNVSAVKFVRVGRSYFSEPRDQIIDLGDGLQMWYGYFQSAILGWKPFLNVDVAHKGFPKEQPVVELMREMAGRDGIENGLGYKTDSVSKFLKGLKVQYEIRGQPATRRTFRVNSLTAVPEQARFALQDGQDTTVMKYFKDEKKYDIRFRQLPCLWVGPRDRKIYLPPELCTILPGQVVNKKLNDIQTSNMVRNAATSTTVRKQKIMNSVQQVGFNDDPTVRAFGLSVGNQFERIQARVLDPPTLKYKENNVNVSRGQWNATQFLKPVKLQRWTVFNLGRTRNELIDNFVSLVLNKSRQLGMQVDKVTMPYENFEQRGKDIRQLISYFQKFKSKNFELVFCIVPEYGDTYSKVKQVAELNVGCLTQCIKAKTMFKMNPATVGNILLKVNAKLNGSNHSLAEVSRPVCLRRPCMIMGADVTHPSPDQTSIPSVAAVAASHDPTAFQYNFCWRLQPPKQEIITDLEAIMMEQLTFFFQKTGYKPEWIIFFRDGVSEGQFKQVLNAEVQAIRRACQRFDKGDYRPAITFLVVQKRHHTRFFPTNPRDSEDRNFNVRAGTLVDTDIIHPTAVEYYLVSHASIQGVARPTKYRMLWDDKNMTEDDIQTLTYYLCHMFSRCTRSVSYPAPTYYAHLAAFRARVYLEGSDINLNKLGYEQGLRQITQEICKTMPMFFV